MGNDDARSLDSQDTGGFAHPRGGQRAGGRKPLGCPAHFGCYRTDNVWLAGALPARRLGRFEGQTVIRPSAEVERARDAMDLRHGDAEEPVAAAIFVRIVDARVGGDADQKKMLAANSVGRLLAQIGITCQKPLHRAIERDESLVRQWLKKEYPKIKAMAKKQGADIYFGDAAHIRSDHHAGRTWGAKGDTPIVQATAARHGMSLISAVTSRGHLRFMIIDKGSVNADVFIEFLKRLIKGAERKIFLIVDRGSAHRAKKVSAFVQTLGAKLYLFFLPPYAPDRNPDELVWKHLKADTVGRMAVTSKEDFARKVRRSMRDLQNDARKIISFFQKPSLKYAA